MKKFLSFVLTILLIATTVITPLSASAETVDYTLGNELVTNGDFSDSTVNTTLSAVCGNNAYEIDKYVSMTPNHYNKWFRPTGGVTYALDAYANNTTIPDTTGEYPVYFKQNATVVAQPDNANEKVLRVVQTAVQYVNATANTTYKLSFRYKTGGKEAFYAGASTTKKTN